MVVVDAVGKRRAFDPRNVVLVIDHSGSRFLRRLPHVQAPMILMGRSEVVAMLKPAIHQEGLRNEPIRSRGGEGPFLNAPMEGRMRALDLETLCYSVLFVLA